MKKIELLAPVGNMDTLYAAVNAGSDAVYLGGKSFGARAFSKNFNDEEMLNAINYCHLYGVKVYVTLNTLIYENEVDNFLNYVEFLHKNNVDAIIIQDIGMLDLVHKTFPNLELHASTQMHIHNLDGVKIAEKLGIKRVVLARETSIDTIKEIKKNTDLEIEIFVHGALCISYSGQCLMSSLIGGRSGNRGTCVGSCRLKYNILDNNNHKLNKNNYPLSTKDLNSLEYIGNLIENGVDSIKIEGRMKSKEYVYKVISLYRKAIDNYYQNNKISINENDIRELKKIFNRDYTKGFLNNTDNNDLINGYRPNHMGVNIGKVISYKNNYAMIKLTDRISIGSGLRILNDKEDIGVNVNEFYLHNKLVKTANDGDIIKIKVNSPVKENSPVLLTLDNSLVKEIDNQISNNPRKVKITGNFIAYQNEHIALTIKDNKHEITVTGAIPEIANNIPISEATIYEKLTKLGNTIYEFDNLSIDLDSNIFISLKEINELKHQAIDLLNQKRIGKSNFIKKEYTINVPDFKQEKLLTSLINNQNQIDNKYNLIYSEEDIEGTIKKYPPIMGDYPENNHRVLISELGGLNKYHNVDTDSSLNVVNSYTVALLHSLGVNKITLSYELNDNQIKDIIDAYHKRYHKHPNLELIVYGCPIVMISKYSLNKTYQKDFLYLQDMYHNKFKVITKDNLMYIYHYQKLDNYNEKYYDIGINSQRFNLDNIKAM